MNHANLLSLLVSLVLWTGCATHQQPQLLSGSKPPAEEKMYDLTVTFGLGVSSSQTITTRIALGREFLVRTTDMQGSTWTIQGVVWSALFGKFTAQLKLSEWWSEASHTEFGMEPELELGQPFSIGSGAVIRMRTVLLQEAKPSAPDPLANPLGRHQNEQTPTPVLKR